MYTPFELVSTMRRTTQLYMLRTLLRETHERFNDKLAATAKAKQSFMDKVGDINQRISEIAKTLGVPADLTELSLDKIETASSFMKVEDDEVKVEKYISPEELEKREAERLAEEERRRNAKGDAPEERALKQMMGGVLESKSEGEEDDEPVRPDWMSETPKEGFTEEQQKLIKEFEQKEKQWKEDKEKKVKALETELKKLRSDVIDNCAKFDELLADTYRARLVTDASANQIELRMVRLGSQLEDVVENSELLEKRLTSKLEELKTSKGKTTAKIAEFRREVDSAKEALDALVAEDKAMDRGFKRDFAETDDLVDALYKLFKRRTAVVRNSVDEGNPVRYKRKSITGILGKMPRRSSKIMSQQAFVDMLGNRRSSTGPTSIPNVADMEMMEPEGLGGRISASSDPSVPPSQNPDPYGDADYGQEPTDVRPTAIEPLSSEYERPEGLENFWWDRLVEVRNRKIASEEEIGRRKVIMEEMQKYMGRLTDEDESLRAQIEQTLRGLQEIRDERQRSMYDLEVPLRMKQGLIEVEQEATSAECRDAVLVHRSVVEELNEVIHKHGGAKVDTLTAIKDFKKGIYASTWENESLDMQAEDLVAKTKELQLLRVTKGLQVFLKSGEDQQNANEIHSLEQRLEHNRKLQEKRLEETRLTLRKLTRELREKEAQNSEIRFQVDQMDQAIQDQARIREARQKELEGKDSGMPMEKRMRSLVTQRKLQDIAKAQAEEMLLLREELERLRLRTFPSFIDKRQTDPDLRFVPAK